MVIFRTYLPVHFPRSIHMYCYQACEFSLVATECECTRRVSPGYSPILSSGFHSFTQTCLWMDFSTILFMKLSHAQFLNKVTQQMHLTPRLSYTVFNNLYISAHPQYFSIHQSTFLQTKWSIANNLISQHINITFAKQWITEFILWGKKEYSLYII
jgi:hypothetical protein